MGPRGSRVGETREMSMSIQLFEFPANGAKVQVMEREGAPAWFAHEIERALGYAQPGSVARLIRRTAEIVEGTHYEVTREPWVNLTHGSKHTSNAIILTEAGLYLVLMR